MPTYLSSNSKTFQLHQPNILKTDPAFKHDIFPYMHRYQQMTSLFIHRMIKLWVPISPRESHNFIPDMLISAPHIHFKLPGTRIPIHDLEPEFMHIKINQKRTQNLAAISFFNYIFNCDFDKTKLYVCQSPETNEWYFVQDHSIYLIDFFKEVFRFKSDNIIHQQLCADTPDKGEIQRRFFDTIDLSDPWIRTVFQTYTRNDIKWICMQDLFKILLRISLTPPSLILQLMKPFIKSLKKEDQLFFANYFLSLIQMIKVNIRCLCTSEEYQHWKFFLKDLGHEVYLEYSKDIIKTAQEFSHIQPSDIQNILHSLHEKAFYIHLPHLLPDCRLPKIQTYPKTLYIGAVNYVLREMQLHWKIIQSNPKHVYWSYLKDLIKHLPQSQFNFFKSPSTFLDVLFLTSIRYHHHEIVKFIFQQNTTFKNQIHLYFDPYDFQSKILKNTSTLLIALYYQNSEICKFLTQNFIKLSELDELKFLELLMNAFLSNNLLTSEFYLNHYPDIFNHPMMQKEIRVTLAVSSPEIQQLFSAFQERFQQNPCLPTTHIRRRRNSFFNSLPSSETAHDLSKLTI